MKTNDGTQDPAKATPVNTSEQIDEILNDLAIASYYKGKGNKAIKLEEEVQSAKTQIEQLIHKAKQEPVGDAIEIAVPAKTMQYVMSKIRLKDKTIADRVLEPLWRVERWRDGKGDKYDLEVYIWKLRILAHLTHRFNWSIFLLKPENIKELRVEALSKGDKDE